MGLGEIGWGGMDWVGLAQGRDKRRALVKAAINLRVRKNSGCATGGLCRRSELRRVRVGHCVVSYIFPYVSYHALAFHGLGLLA
jgi:hypothetical protein